MGLTIVEKKERLTSGAFYWYDLVITNVSEGVYCDDHTKAGFVPDQKVAIVLLPIERQLTSSEHYTIDRKYSIDKYMSATVML